MSFYRKSADDPVAEVPTAATPGRPEPTEAEKRMLELREAAAKAKRSKGEPANTPLPRTLAWAASLPEDVRPNHLLRQYGRIANLLAASWTDVDATYAYLDDLLLDRRGNRKGFPREVMSELLALRTHYALLHPPKTGGWLNFDHKL